jgi:hypothetical protein
METLAVPQPAPRINPARRTKKLDRVTGTGPMGIRVYAPRIIRAVKRDARIIVLFIAC